jgi:hypothetical protein
MSGAHREQGEKLIKCRVFGQENNDPQSAAEATVG